MNTVNELNEIMVNAKFGRLSEKRCVRSVVQVSLEKNSEFSKQEQNFPLTFHTPVEHSATHRRHLDE